MRMPSRSVFVSVLTLLFVSSLIVFATRTRAVNSVRDSRQEQEAGSNTAATSIAQEPQTPPVGTGTGQDRPARPEVPAEPKPYDKVITKDAKSDPGVFTVHTLKEKVYYEIPKSELGKEFLWVSQIARTTLGAGYGGQAAGNRVVKWERKNNHVLLRSVSYDVVADPSLPVARAVQASNNDTIIMAFNVEAFGKDDSCVIEVSKLFTTEVTEFSARTRLRARGFDPARSFIEKVKSFPSNIETEVSQTYTSPPACEPEPTPPLSCTTAWSSFRKSP